MEYLKHKEYRNRSIDDTKNRINEIPKKLNELLKYKRESDYCIEHKCPEATLLYIKDIIKGS